MINDDNNPFTMASIKERVLVVDKPYKLLPHMWKKGPHYDQETDTWLMTRESFNADSIKFFEVSTHSVLCIIIIHMFNRSISCMDMHACTQ